jgi:hypothetical protein
MAAPRSGRLLRRSGVCLLSETTIAQGSPGAAPGLPLAQTPEPNDKTRSFLETSDSWTPTDDPLTTLTTCGDRRVTACRSPRLCNGHQRSPFCAPDRRLDGLSASRRFCGFSLACPTVVNCWIGVTQEGDRRLVRLAGQLGDAQVPELFHACGTCEPGARGYALQLDLTELVSADAAGIEALQRVRDSGATLLGASGYIQLKLDACT